MSELAISRVRLSLIVDTKRAIRVRSFIVPASVAEQIKQDLSGDQFVGIKVVITADPAKRSRFDKVGATVQDVLAEVATIL